MNWVELVEPQLHVWVVPLEADADAAASLLAPAERERAARFRREAHRRRWIVAHAALRSLVGRYLGADPRHVCLETAPGGKPGVQGLQFGLSHSHELALVAVAAHTPVGVDVEYVRTIPEAPLLARRLLSPEEAALVEAQPEQFLRIWTRWEACLKAEGLGLRGLGRPRPPGWRVLDLDPAPGYVGAVACRGRPHLVIRRFAPCGG